MVRMTFFTENNHSIGTTHAKPQCVFAGHLGISGPTIRFRTLEVVIPPKKCEALTPPSLIELGDAIFEKNPEQKRLKSISSSWVK